MLHNTADCNSESATAARPLPNGAAPPVAEAAQPARSTILTLARLISGYWDRERALDERRPELHEAEKRGENVALERLFDQRAERECWRARDACEEVILRTPARTPEEALVQLTVVYARLHAMSGEVPDEEETPEALTTLAHAAHSALLVLRRHIVAPVGSMVDDYAPARCDALERIAT